MTFYLVSGKKEGEVIKQWIINAYQTKEEAELQAQGKPWIWLSNCRDWEIEELDAGYRYLMIAEEDDQTNDL